MLISWIKTSTLLDYPGKVAAIIFTLGCNLRCGFCHNPEFVDPVETKKLMNDLISESAFFKFLETRKDFLDGIVICGGEPTIHRDLVEFAAKIKSYGLLVKLDTNGSNPQMLETLLDSKLVDYVAMDIKDPFSKYARLTGKEIGSDGYERSVSLLIDSGIDYEFRSTLIGGWHTPEDVESMATSIRWARAYYLQNYRPGKTLDPHFSGRAFTSEELKGFRDLALQYVSKCSIRL